MEVPGGASQCQPGGPTGGGPSLGGPLGPQVVSPLQGYHSTVDSKVSHAVYPAEQGRRIWALKGWDPPVLLPMHELSIPNQAPFHRALEQSASLRDPRCDMCLMWLFSEMPRHTVCCLCHRAQQTSTSFQYALSFDFLPAATLIHRNQVLHRTFR